MSRHKVDGKKLARAAAGGIAEWWTDYALDWHRTHGSKENDAQLGIKLAKVVGRAAPWSHPTIGRFFRKDDERRATAEIADALLLLYPELPPYAIEPGDLQEALELAAVHKRAEARRGSTHPIGVTSSRPTARDIIIDRLKLHDGVSATPKKAVDARQPGDLLSANGVEARPQVRPQHDERVDDHRARPGGMGRRRP